MVGNACPAAHSLAMPPDATLLLAELIASRRVQTPSFAVVSRLLLTVIVAAAAVFANAAKNASSNATGAELGRRVMDASANRSWMGFPVRFGRSRSTVRLSVAQVLTDSGR